MNEPVKSIMERRSIRKYKPAQIPNEELNLILEAGMYAPNAYGYTHNSYGADPQCWKGVVALHDYYTGRKRWE
ncbi:MAG: nitroreductase family protein [Syntrophomonadaceae bacterium]|jgi:nitroreductase|nr:nitroreductase family protein [Syntrophomonadaceae bacterium]